MNSEVLNRKRNGNQKNEEFKEEEENKYKEKKDGKIWIYLTIGLFIFSMIELFIIVYLSESIKGQNSKIKSIENRNDLELIKSFIDVYNITNPNSIIGAMLPQNTNQILNKSSHDFHTANILIVTILTLISAIASGLGGIPFFFIKNLSHFFIGVCNAMAGGLMVSASISLFIEGFSSGFLVMIFGVTCGVVFIIVSQKFLDEHEDIKVGNLEGIDARKVLLIMSVMTLHSLAEGIGMGVSFGGGEKLGVFITIAISIHNIPEGVAVALVMVPRGVSPIKATLWAIFSSLPQPIMAIPSFIFVEYFTPLLPWGLGFAAGAMGYMVITELIPEALEEAKSVSIVSIVMTLSILLMFLFQYLVLDSLLDSHYQIELSET